MVKHGLVLNEVWSNLWPLVSADVITAARVTAELNSINVASGAYLRYLHAGTTMLEFSSQDAVAARVVVFGSSIPLGVLQCRGEIDGWWLEKLVIRSSLYRSLEPLCRRVGLPLEADGNIVSLQPMWSPQI